MALLPSVTSCCGMPKCWKEIKLSSRRDGQFDDGFTVSEGCQVCHAVLWTAISCWFMSGMLWHRQHSRPLEGALQFGFTVCMGRSTDALGRLHLLPSSHAGGKQRRLLQGVLVYLWQLASRHLTPDKVGGTLCSPMKPVTQLNDGVWCCAFKLCRLMFQLTIPAHPVPLPTACAPKAAAALTRQLILHPGCYRNRGSC